MQLFEADPAQNLLPTDGEVSYFGPIVDTHSAIAYRDQLLKEIEWRNDEVFIYGKRIITKRKVAWYGDKNYSYTYSNTTRYALPWNKALLELKTLAETHSGITFNSCLLNLYNNGEEGMSWHSDDEKELGRNTTIASMSFGAERPFLFKHKVSGKQVSVMLEHGSLLIMKGATQSHWLHSLPKRAGVKDIRVNLTFRTIKDRPLVL